ncbi:hypothetical protein ACTQ5R_04835 [Ruoffia tabacinasalis]|uniref:hypothetical protein n=1 Tax=Ruoffia tabacinasalis TaxID=87458 RepID=UPI003F9AF058
MKNMIKGLVMLLLFTMFVPLMNHVHATSETSSTDAEMVPEWVITLFEDKAQENKMLDRAWEDYQTAIEDYQLADLETMDPGTSYAQVIGTYNPDEDIEVKEESAEDGTATISYIYRAEEGDLNPNTGIEDWAQVDFYFVNENLIYTGITTLSLAFMADGLVSTTDHSALVSDNASVDELVEVENFELNGFGQIKVDGEYAYGVGYPKESTNIGEGGLLIIQDGQVVDDSTATFEDLMAYSFSGFIYLMLVSQVDNQVFEPAP